MKDYNFKIKIGDLLIDPNTEDKVDLTNKFSTKIPHLTDDGVNATVTVVGLDEKTVLITIDNAVCQLDDSCDVCGKEITYRLQTSGDAVKVFVGEDEDKKRENEGDTIYIEEGASVVDIESFLIDSLLLKDSVKHVCEACEDRDEEPTQEEPIGSVKREYSSDS